MKKTFTQKLKHLTRLIKGRSPHLTWREAQGEARGDLYDRRIYPSYDASLKEFMWKREQGIILDEPDAANGV